MEGAICLLSDLTEIADLQNQIKLKENFAALGEMSAGIAHEFKNSIATVLGYAQLSSGEASVEVLHNYAKEIEKESQSMSTIVTDFLNFARPVNPSILEVDLDALLESVWRCPSFVGNLKLIERPASVPSWAVIPLSYDRCS